MTESDLKSLEMAGVVRLVGDGQYQLTPAGAALAAYWLRSGQGTPTADNRPAWAYKGKDWNHNKPPSPDGGRPVTLPLVRKAVGA